MPLTVLELCLEVGQVGAAEHVDLAGVAPGMAVLVARVYAGGGRAVGLVHLLQTMIGKLSVSLKLSVLLKRHTQSSTFRFND